MALGTLAASRASAVPAVRSRVETSDRDLLNLYGDGFIGRSLLQSRAENNERLWLMRVNIDDLLAPYRSRPGVQEWAGEYIGKWLHAASASYRRSRSSALGRRIAEAALALIETQEADGYLGTYLARDRWTSWDVWAHKYNMIGLLAVHEALGTPGVMTAIRRMADLLVDTFGSRPGQLDIAAPSHGTHMGLAAGSVLEPMAVLARTTGAPKYLQFCRMIVDGAWEQPHGPKVISGLLRHGKVAKIANGKAYEMLSCLVGVAELYRATGDDRYLKACETAWQNVRLEQNYPIGTSSWAEHFEQRRPDGDYYHSRGDHLGLKYCGPGEGCVTATWLQLSSQLLRLTGQPWYADEIERTVYNALIGAQSPLTGQLSYFVPLNGRKRYGEVNHGILPDICCCAFSLPRAIAAMPGLCAGRLGTDPAILLYEAGRIDIGGGLSVDVAGDFPAHGDLSLKISLSAPRRFVLHLRVPDWARSFTATIGQRSYSGRSGSFAKLDRVWRDGDIVKIALPMAVENEPFLDGTVYRRGPQILSWDSSIRRETRLPGDWKGSQLYEVDRAGQRVALVPFADAGQARADYISFFRSGTTLTG